MRETDITGKSRTEWEVIPKKREGVGAGETPLPNPADLWDLDHVPHLIRSIVQAQYLDRGEYPRWIKPQYREWVEKQKRRMSGTMFRIYMLSQWAVPTAMCNDIAMKYGVHIKKMATQVVYSILAIRNLTLERFQEKLLGVEAAVRREIRRVYGCVRYAM